MRRRTLLIALAAAALYAVVVTSASAELHRLSVKLTNGQSVELTVDVPAGSSVQDVALPALPAPVDSVVDLGPVSTPTPTPTATATPMQTPSPTVTATPTPGNIGSGDNSGATGGGGNSGGGSGNIGGSKPKPGKVVGGAEGNGEVLEGKLDDKDLDLDKRSRDDAEPTPDPQNPTVNTDGSPTLENPTVSLAEPGAARIGVPNFFIDKFRIPPFLLPIYQAAGIEYGVRWEVLAAINEVETDYGRNLNVSSAGALGWMQFMPSSWEAYGVDANKDGLKDPYNPADAIFAAARYLKAAGADKDLRGAIWAYNHADWYVDMVLLRARLIGGLPADLVGSLTGLTQGRFPVQAKAMYANEVKRADLENDKGTPAYVVDSEAQRDGIRVFAKKGAPVVAVNDGRIVDAGRSRRLGNYVKLQDVYGNTYTYGHLGSVVQRYPVPRRRTVTDAEKRARAQAPAARRRSGRPGLDDHRGGGRGAQGAHRREVAHEGGRQGDRRPDRPARQAAPVRPPGAPALRRRRRRAAGDRAGRGLRRLPQPRLRPRPHRRRHEAARRGRPRHRRHGPRPHRPRRARHGPARPLRDPPGGQGRAADRPEADPRRLEAARVDRHLPRGRPQPVRGQGRGHPVGRPDPADEQGGADPARPRRPERLDLRLRPARHPHGSDRPPRAGHARVPRRQRAQADGDVAALRPLVPDQLRQRLGALDGHRGRHRGRSTASRSRRRRRDRAPSPRSRSSAC